MKSEGSEGSDTPTRKLAHRLRFSRRIVKLKLFEISIMPMILRKIQRIGEEEALKEQMRYSSSSSQVAANVQAS